MLAKRALQLWLASQLAQAASQQGTARRAYGPCSYRLSGPHLERQDHAVWWQPSNFLYRQQVLQAPSPGPVRQAARLAAAFLLQPKPLWRCLHMQHARQVPPCSLCAALSRLHLHQAGIVSRALAPCDPHQQPPWQPRSPRVAKDGAACIFTSQDHPPPKVCSNLRRPGDGRQAPGTHGALARPG